MTIRAILVIITMSIAAFLVYAGFEYIHVGHGLNPLVAFPGAALFIIGPHLLLAHEAEQYEVELEDLLEEIEILSLVGITKGELSTTNGEAMLDVLRDIHHVLKGKDNEPDHAD